MIRQHLEQIMKDQSKIASGKVPKQKELVTSYERNQAKNQKDKAKGKVSNTQQKINAARQKRADERKVK